jgi:hypothetical protein
MKRKLAIIGGVVVVLCIALSCSQGDANARPALVTAPAADMKDLKNIDQLKEVFQRDRGRVRLVSLLSPV